MGLSSNPLDRAIAAAEDLKTKRIAFELAKVAVQVAEREFLAAVSGVAAGDNDTPELTALMAMIAARFHTTSEDMKAPGRDASMTDARTAFVYFARRLTRASYPQIGKAMDRDHTSAMYLEQHAQERMTKRSSFARVVAELSVTLQPQEQVHAA